jgi:hypothetical protein
MDLLARDDRSFKHNYNAEENLIFEKLNLDETFPTAVQKQLYLLLSLH